MQNVSPIVKQIGELVDKRFQTFTTIVKAEIHSAINASEERVTKNLRAEIKASEERMTKKIEDVEDRMMGVEGKLQHVETRLQVVEDKLDKNLKDHDERIERLEDHADLTTATS